MICPKCKKSYGFADADIKAGRVINECPHCQGGGFIKDKKNYFSGDAIEGTKTKKKKDKWNSEPDIAEDVEKED